MAALGRWLGIVGWLWFAAGFVAPALGIADIEFFPGLILVFIGRLLRIQAKRQESDEQSPPVQAEPPRPLNTERTQPEPAPAAAQPEMPKPPILTDHTPPPSVAYERPSPAEKEATREKLFAKTPPPAEKAEEAVADVERVLKDATERKPLTSEEMIARAHERWDRPAKPG